MERIQLAICDDDAEILGVISGAITSAFRRHGIAAEVKLFHRPQDLLARMKEQNFDLLFLDIDMPGMDGITFARKIRGWNSHTEIIFVSNREDKVFDALRTSPEGFIRKSRFLEDVPAVIDLWIRNRPQGEENRLVIKDRDGTVALDLDRVLYIESYDKLQYIHISGQKDTVPVRRSMQELEEALTPRGFLRVHKGYLVNYRFIRRLENTEVVLTGGERIPMSRRRVQEIRTQYMELVQNGRSVIL